MTIKREKRSAGEKKKTATRQNQLEICAHTTQGKEYKKERRAEKK